MFDQLQPVKLSTRAAEEVKKIMQTKNIPDGYGLRIGVRGGHGCGGAQLIIGFDKKKEGDLAYLNAGVNIYVDKKHTMYVIGKEVDWIDNEAERGFTFI
ncbi:MAG: iron-sulfur cluster biosynthesis family protein [Bacteroidota bacterium]